MKFQDLVAARISREEPVAPRCQIDFCEKPVASVVTVLFPDLPPRRISLCCTCLKRVQVEQSPPSKPVGTWPEPVKTFTEPPQCQAQKK